MRLMNSNFLAALFLISASLATGAEKAHSVNKPDTFRFLRIEEKTFPADELVPGGPLPATTVTYGVFAFRYSHAKPLEFSGFAPPEGRRFTTRFTGYRVLKKSGWAKFPVLYCGTGAKTYILQPGVDYELRISLDPLGLPAGSRVRVSAGPYWSESFIYAK